MKKNIAISDGEKLEHLVEEIKSILTESVFSARMTLLEAKHLVGETISRNSLYKKSGKGSGRLVKDLAKRLGRSEKDIYLCINFYKKFPKIERLIQTLRGKKNDITWAAARRLLEGDKEIGEHTCEWETIERCKICKKIKKENNLCIKSDSKTQS